MFSSVLSAKCLVSKDGPTFLWVGGGWQESLKFGLFPLSFACVEYFFILKVLAFCACLHLMKYSDLLNQ